MGTQAALLVASAAAWSGGEQQQARVDAASMAPGSSSQHRHQHQQQPQQQLVSIDPFSLVFSDAALEAGFRGHQHHIWAASELRCLSLNVLAGAINFSITIALLEKGAFFTWRSARVMLPYMTVALAHRLLAARWQRWPRYRGVGKFAAEACYSTICTVSMPTWVLHGPVADAKAFLRQWVLGSGVLIGIWCRFLTPTFFCSARLLVPLQFAFQGLLLTGPTCGSLTATPYGAAAAAALSRSLDAAAAATGMRSCGGASCSNLMALLQLAAGGTLLYLLYRLERANRLAYLAGRARVTRDWPCVPGYVAVLLHGLALLQLCSAAWVGLQCSAARGGT